MRNKRVCDYIAEAIQNEILSGRMSSGVPLRQEELADSLGYSRIPIREALQILESQGVAKRLATRHVVVADFSDEVITEIYELLSDVEIKLLKGMLQSGICLWDKAVSDNSEQPNCVHEPSAINENCLQSCSFMRQLYPIVITSILHIFLKMVSGAISGLRLKRRQQAGKMREDLSCYRK